MLSPTYEITTALSHTDELISPPYDIAIVTISYGRVTMSSVWDSMMSKKNMGWPFYAAVQPRSLTHWHSRQFWEVCTGYRHLSLYWCWQWEHVYTQHVPFWTDRRAVILNQALIDDREQPGQGLYAYKKVTEIQCEMEVITNTFKQGFVNSEEIH